MSVRRARRSRPSSAANRYGHCHRKYNFDLRNSKNPFQVSFIREADIGHVAFREHFSVSSVTDLSYGNMQN